MKTTERKIRDFVSKRWGIRSLERVALKFAEEAGEIAGAVVKEQEGRCTLSHLDDEVGDALIVLSQIAAIRGTTLSRLRARRFKAIVKRAKKHSGGRR